MKRLFLVLSLLVPFATAQEQGRPPRREGPPPAELHERLQVARQRLDQLRQRLQQRREELQTEARDPQQGGNRERPDHQRFNQQRPNLQRRGPERQQGGTPPQRRDAARGGAEMPRRFDRQGGQAGGSMRPLMHEFLLHRLHRLEMLEQADRRGEPTTRANPQGRKARGAAGNHRRGPGRRGIEV